MGEPHKSLGCTMLYDSKVIVQPREDMQGEQAAATGVRAILISSLNETNPA